MGKSIIHNVANKLVTEAVEHGCDAIMFEDLIDSRERLPRARWHHVWAFRCPVEYVSYKALEQGVSAE
ncbi:transposase, IS605 OrfB family protein [Halorubrum coriense DSM 10284]|uniref:Transposase, IS605 OrfB family protein n=1 Tax=Halorubrum coriense DSM 10284 TaxID=1227466 RepID=M0E5X2_9EURY|nr:transposase, IS605 OrfB family protein [Halorubrum coriense DSM 10284]